jgi:RimJ/RimL family protein N-acetyltransferase
MANERPLGAQLEWEPAARPGRTPLRGEHVVIRPVMAVADAVELYAESHPPRGDPELWMYLPTGPYPDVDAFKEDLLVMERSEDPLFFTLIPLPGQHPAGVASYLRITPEHGVIEIGHIWFGASLRRTTAAAETIYLLAAHAFDELGYRRLEWKCNALNEASRRAAQRFGFRFEGVFRSHMVVKGHNRDTAWYAITLDEWPTVRAGFQAWLAPENHDEAGRQGRPLSELIAEARGG